MPFIVYPTAGSLVRPRAHTTGDFVADIVPKSIENAKLGKSALCGMDVKILGLPGGIIGHLLLSSTWLGGADKCVL